MRRFRTKKVAARVLVSVAIITSSTASQQAVKAEIGQDGTAHIPSVQVPYSELASPEAKKSFVEVMSQVHELGANKPKADERRMDIRETIRETRRLIDEKMQIPGRDRLLEAFSVDIKPKIVGGVQTDVVVPKTGISPANRNRVLINLHGGGNGRSSSLWRSGGVDSDRQPWQNQGSNRGLQNGAGVVFPGRKRGCCQSLS